MTKKILIMGILMIPFLLLTRMATAQNYADMPPAIQAKMDQNKIDGKDYLTGIYVHYEIQFGGIDTDEQILKLQQLLASNAKAVNYYFDESNKHVSFTCDAKYNLKALKAFLKDEGLEINHLFKQEYSLEK